MNRAALITLAAANHFELSPKVWVDPLGGSALGMYFISGVGHTGSPAMGLHISVASDSGAPQAELF